jgi:hypothetical protein
MHGLSRELLSLRGVCGCDGVVADLATEEQSQGHERTVPAGPDVERARAATGHLDGHGVFEFEHGVPVPGRRQAQFDQARRPTKGHREQARRLASEDLASCVAFELERSANTSVTADRKKPSLHAVWVGHRVQTSSIGAS